MTSSCSDLCRACLSPSNVPFRYILVENVSSEMYCFCTSIEVTGDDLPKALCDPCYELLLKYTEFKNTCLASQNTLLSKYESKIIHKEEMHNNHTQSKNTQEPVNIKSENFDFTDDFEAFKTEDLFDHYGDESEAVNSCEERCSGNQIIIKKRIKKKIKRPRIKSTIPKTHFAFACDICNKKFNYHDRLQAHKLEHEGKMAIIHCVQCKKQFKTWGGLKRHNDNEHTLISLDKLKCSICSKVCKTRQTLKTHKKTHGERKMFVCDICGKEFTSKYILKTHIDTHKDNRERNYTCEHCGKKFYTNSVLLSHMSKRHSGRRYICHMCSYPFTDKYNLAKHLLIHDGKKLFQCQICNKSYSSRATLVEHQRTHSGERPYVCSFCPKSFLSKRQLNEHHRIHNGERPYKCAVCEQRFTQRGSLKRHSKVHDRLIN